MKIAYLIAAHQDARQLKRLISALYVPNHTDFFIHVDSKVDMSPFEHEVSDFTQAGDNRIIFSQNRHNVMWGTFSQCKYQLSLIKECLEVNEEYDRVIFLSGLDYPVWSNERLFKFWTNNPNLEYIAGINISSPMMEQRQRRKVDRYYFFPPSISNHKVYKFFRRVSFHIITPLIRLIKKKNPMVMIQGKECPIYYGSSWWGITYKCLRGIWPILNDKDYQKFFRTGFTPDEQFIQTAVYNSRFSENCIGGDDKTRPVGLTRLTPMHLIDYKDSIKIFTTDDYEEVIRSDKMFIRKVVSGKSDVLIEKLEINRCSNKSSGI